MNTTAEQLEEVRKIIAQGMAARIPAQFTAQKISDKVATFPFGSVWIAEIQLAESLIAVATTEKLAVRNCAIRALEFLENRDVLDENGDHYTIDSLVEYFGCRVTECELDGAGERH